MPKRFDEIFAQDLERIGEAFARDRPRDVAQREMRRREYSWDGVARSVIAAARGELDGLPLPAPDIQSNG